MSAILFISLWYCQMMLCIHSFYDPRLLVTMNVQRYLQQHSSTRVLLFATSNHNNNFDNILNMNKNDAIKYINSFFINYIDQYELY